MITIETRGSKKTANDSPTYQSKSEKKHNFKAANENEQMYDLGMSYELGKGVNKDYGEAVKWYFNAAIGGNKSAKNALFDIISELFSVDIYVES